MEIRGKKERNAMVVSVSGRLDAVTSLALEKGLSAMISEGEKTLILDFEALDYISSAGLRVILAAAKKIKLNGGELRLACLRGVVKEVFDVSGFETVVPCFDTVEDAASLEN